MKKPKKVRLYQIHFQVGTDANLTSIRKLMRAMVAQTEMLPDDMGKTLTSVDVDIFQGKKRHIELREKYGKYGVNFRY